MLNVSRTQINYLLTHSPPFRAAEHKKSPLPHTHRETGLEKVITQTDSRLLAYYEIWLISKQVDGQTSCLHKFMGALQSTRKLIYPSTCQLNLLAEAIEVIHHTNVDVVRKCSALGIRQTVRVTTLGHAINRVTVEQRQVACNTVAELTTEVHGCLRATITQQQRRTGI